MFISLVSPGFVLIEPLVVTKKHPDWLLHTTWKYDRCIGSIIGNQEIRSLFSMTSCFPTSPACSFARVYSLIDFFLTFFLRCGRSWRLTQTWTHHLELIRNISFQSLCTQKMTLAAPRCKVSPSTYHLKFKDTLRMESAWKCNKPAQLQCNSCHLLQCQWKYQVSIFWRCCENMMQDHEKCQLKFL